MGADGESGAKQPAPEGADGRPYLRPHPLNFEAGATPMPEDPREIEAAMRAGIISQRCTPYYGLRYGERGMRFTRSDSAWLVTVAGYSDATAQRQIGWLAGVLANRGMPSLLLEQHLGVLARQLTRAVPERRDAFRTLTRAAAWLGAQRRGAIPDETATRLASAFVSAAQLPDTRLSRSTGGLIVAAVADERLGQTNAVASLESFFCDRALFPARFVEAVRTTVRRARAS
jgi:hypothetical protein